MFRAHKSQISDVFTPKSHCLTPLLQLSVAISSREEAFFKLARFEDVYEVMAQTNSFALLLLLRY